MLHYRGGNAILFILSKILNLVLTDSRPSDDRASRLGSGPNRFATRPGGFYNRRMAVDAAGAGFTWPDDGRSHRGFVRPLDSASVN